MRHRLKREFASPTQPAKSNGVWYPSSSDKLYRPEAGRESRRTRSGRLLLAPSALRGFDLMPDGRFIGRIAPGQAADAAGTWQPEIRIVEYWTEELKRLVPVK